MLVASTLTRVEGFTDRPPVTEIASWATAPEAMFQNWDDVSTLMVQPLV